jgi:LmbE family N-acetylglucosaminyl deacetylase
MFNESEDGKMKNTVMAVFAHADDVSGKCGGTLAKWASEGWKVILVRVTNDDKDSHNLPTKAATERANTEEYLRAAEILGASVVEDLGFVTDVLGDVSMVALRERIVYMFRKYKPYAVFSFDPYAPYEPNLDHRCVGQAVEEAYWVSNFHLHYPEHLEEGYQPHSVCERWYFARSPIDANFAEDITDHFEQKIAALCAHDKQVRNTLHQLQLHLKTWGRRVPQVDEAILGDLRPLVEMLVRQGCEEVAAEFGLGSGRLAEIFRVNRFGAMEAFVQRHSVPLLGEPETMHTRPCFDPESALKLHN